MAKPTSPPAQGKRERNKARNRRVILDAARDVFVDIGYDAATVRDIVARTDLAPGTFYNYFPDKSSVLLALVEEVTALGVRKVREARAQAKSIEEFVVSGFRAYFEFVASERVLFELMRRNIATLRTLSAAETGFSVGLSDLNRELQAAMRKGNLPPIDLEYAVAAVGAVVIELGAKMVAREPPDVDGVTEFASALFLGALERTKRAVRPKKSGAQRRR